MASTQHALRPLSADANLSVDGYKSRVPLDRRPVVYSADALDAWAVVQRQAERAVPIAACLPQGSGLNDRNERVEPDVVRNANVA